jgi:hypothetical protein
VGPTGPTHTWPTHAWPTSTQVVGGAYTTAGSANSPPVGGGTRLDFVRGPGGNGPSLGAGGLGQGAGAGKPFNFTAALSGGGGSAFTLHDFVGASGGPAAGLSPLDVLQGANVTAAGGAVDNPTITLPVFRPSGGHG